MLLNILHVGDLHMSDRDVKEIVKVRDALIADVKKVTDANSLKLHMVFFAGDLIKKGEVGAAEYELSLSHFILPLLGSLGLTEDNLYIVPGNHEIDRSRINQVYETGLDTSLTSIDAYNSYKSKLVIEGGLDAQLIGKKLAGFLDFKSILSNRNLITSTFFYDTYKTEIDGVSVGIAGFNSAWRSTNYRDDFGYLVIGGDVVANALKDISECNVKIALAHHGFDMLTVWDRIELQRVMAKNLVLPGIPGEVKNSINDNGSTAVF